MLKHCSLLYLTFRIPKIEVGDEAVGGAGSESRILCGCVWVGWGEDKVQV